MSKHDLAKLENYANANLEDHETQNNETMTNEFSISNIQDITEILKNMLVRVEGSRMLTVSEHLIEILENIRFGAFIPWSIGILSILVKDNQHFHTY